MKTLNFFKKPWVVASFLVIVLSNVPPVKGIFKLIFDEYHYRYSNQSGSLTYVEFKAHDSKGLYRKLNSYKISFPHVNDTIVYRLFKRNILCFWRWGEYIYDDRYRLPYEKWKKIELSRGYTVKYANNWQDF